MWKVWQLAGAGVPALLLCAAVGPAHAQSDPTVPLADLIEVLVIGRELVAVDAGSGGRLQERLNVGEELLWTGARGAIGVALTDERFLAVTTRSAEWQERRYRRTESPVQKALLGDRVALVLTGERALAFDGGSGNVVEGRLGPGESVVEARVGENVVVVVTSRRALGLSPQAGGFFAQPLGLRERVEGVSARANLATVTTDRRILVFQGPIGNWTESRRSLQP